MSASRRQEALRRAAEMAAKAQLVRTEAEDVRRLAQEVSNDEAVRQSLDASAATMDLAAQSYERTSGKYLAMYGGVDVVQDVDDDADEL
jgi:hypothetical protein